MIDGRVIRAVDCTADTFRKCLGRIKDRNRQDQIKAALRELLLTNLDQPAGFLHLHQLRNREVPSNVRANVKVNPWTIHVTRDDTLKASFTLEDGVAYFRLCDEHDVIDKNP